jgi:hypothetical protein
MRRILRATTATIFAGAIVVAAGVAQAGTGQCYDQTGRPVGPTYNTDRPNVSFHRWVAGIGGRCRRIKKNYFGSSKRPYPQAYLNRGGARPRPRGPIYRGRAQLAGLRPNINPEYAARLVKGDYQSQGYDWVRVRNSGLIIYVRGRLWHYLQVRTSDGSRHKVALRQNRRGLYVALVNSGYGWNARRVIRK